MARNSIALLNQNPDDNEWQIPLARALNELGMIRMALNQLIEAEIAFEQFLTFSRRWSYLRGQGIACTNLGHVCRQLHNRTRAEECYTLGRDISLQAEHPFEAAEAIYGLGLLHLEDQTTPEQAQPFFDQALELARKTNNHDISTHIFLSRADLQQQMGNEVNPVGC